MAGSFSAQVEAAVAKVHKRLEATFKASVQDISTLLTTPVTKGGRMRVDTGFLRSSLMASTAAMPSIRGDARPQDGESYDLDAGAIEAVIIGASIMDTIYLGFTAAYARPREYRDGFVEGAVQQWQQIVTRNAGRALAAFP